MTVRTLHNYEPKKRRKKGRSISVSGKTCTLITTLLDGNVCEGEIYKQAIYV
jgi:hypothetical protein